MEGARGTRAALVRRIPGLASAGERIVREAADHA
jgi:hypothetical protein